MEKKGVAAVFDYIKATMPADDPATLEDAEYLDILAYLIQANGFPAGPGELTPGICRASRAPPRDSPQSSTAWNQERDAMALIPRMVGRRLARVAHGAAAVSGGRRDPPWRRRASLHRRRRPRHSGAVLPA